MVPEPIRFTLQPAQSVVGPDPQSPVTILGNGFDLVALARGYMRGEQVNDVLQTTALVHEAYMRLVGEDVQWQGRDHFFAIAAGMMRRILVDFARHRRAEKRGGGADPVSLDEARLAADPEWKTEPDLELMALDDALTRLAGVDERKSRIVELRFFGGLTIEETAGVLGVSHATVERDFKMAKAWLSQAMG